MGIEMLHDGKQARSTAPPSTAMSRLALLARADTEERLRALGLPWEELDRQAAAATLFKCTESSTLRLVGLIGGASAGKSTIFNALVGHEVSRVSPRAHETVGPIAGVPAARLDETRAAIEQGSLLLGFDCLSAQQSREVVRGTVSAVHLCGHEMPGCQDVMLLDLPDVTSRMSLNEGSVARQLLPWFDALVVVADEERWFDAAVFEETVEFARQFAPQLWVVFNQTEGDEALSTQQRDALMNHALARRAGQSCISPFQTGAGYRPISTDTIARIRGWLSDLNASERPKTLEAYVRRKCSTLLRQNVVRSEQYEDLRRSIHEQLALLTAEARLSTDLLTADERRLLGVGHRFVPLYDAFFTAKRWLTGGAARGRPSVMSHSSDGDGIDFDKDVNRLADVLRRNLEHRFGHATASIDRVWADAAYLSDCPGDWQPSWTTPSFDALEWARRIRSHIDAWRAEAKKQSRQGDTVALAVGMPLLLADLIFLGGAGFTLSWAAVWAAGFFGGKGIARALQGSPAFEEYQTTVRAYQAFLREALTEQWMENFAQMPKRHLAMTDPILQAIMAWSTTSGR